MKIQSQLLAGAGNIMELSPTIFGGEVLMPQPKILSGETISRDSARLSRYAVIE